MGANFSRYFIESPGNTILAENYNAEFDNILDNLTPVGIDDASVTLSAYRVTVDPGEVSTESLPTDLAGELHRIRHILGEIVGKTYWYESPDGPLPATPSASTDNGVVRFDGTAGNSLQSSEVTIDDDNNITVDQKVVAASSANTTFTGTAGNSGSVTDADPWDLSNAAVSDLVVTSGGSKGVVSLVLDGSDVVNITEWYPTAPTNGETVEILRGGDVTVKGVDVHSNLLGAVPIGTILDHWNASGTLTYPANFLPCNGQTVDDPESPLDGVTLPDLNTSDGVFTIGSNVVSQDDTLKGDVNHSVSLPAHTHSMTHNHGLPALTGWIGKGNSMSGAGTYDVWNDGGDSTDNNIQVSNSVGEIEGQHRHNLGGNTNNYTGDTGGLSTSSSISILSRSLPVTKIIRIK